MTTNNLKDFDFVRFSVADVHGISRGKTVPSSVADRFLQNGMHVYAGKAFS